MVEKIHVDNMNFRQLDFAFAKVLGLMLGDDSVVVKNNNGGLSVYHLSKFSPTRDPEMLMMVLNQKNIVVKPEKTNNRFQVQIKGKTISEENELLVIVKYCIFLKVENTMDIPKKIR
jgi:hypothetical protein